MYNFLITVVKPIFELLYFIAGIIIAITAIYALKQIKLMKKSISIQSMRDSLRITADQCTDYLSRIISLQDMLNSFIDNNEIKYFDGWKIKINANSIELNHEGRIDFSNFEKLECHGVFNAMESFSTYFTSEVANEKIAFDTVGKTFINTVEKYLPLILSMNDDGYYKNIVKLFMLWKKRSIQISLKREKEKIESEMKSHIIKEIRPIGVD